MTDLVEPVAGILDADALRISHPQPERIADRHAFARGLQRDRFEGPCRPVRALAIRILARGAQRRQSR